MRETTVNKAVKETHRHPRGYGMRDASLSWWPRSDGRNQIDRPTTSRGDRNGLNGYPTAIGYQDGEALASEWGRVPVTASRRGSPATRSLGLATAVFGDCDPGLCLERRRDGDGTGYADLEAGWSGSRGANLAGGACTSGVRRSRPTLQGVVHRPIETPLNQSLRRGLP